MVAKHYLDADEAELTCADWQWGSGLTTITVNKLCVGYRQHRLVIEQARITPQHIDIEKAALALAKQQTQPSSGTGKPQALNLPLTDSRPLVTIESSCTRLTMALHAVRMTVSEPQLNQWVLNGDIAGDIAITSQHIDYELQANQALRAQLMAVAEPSLMRFNISQWALPGYKYKGAITETASITRSLLPAKLLGNIRLARRGVARVASRCAPRICVALA